MDGKDWSFPVVRGNRRKATRSDSVVSNSIDLKNEGGTTDHGEKVIRKKWQFQVGMC